MLLISLKNIFLYSLPALCGYNINNTKAVGEGLRPSPAFCNSILKPEGINVTGAFEKYFSLSPSCFLRAQN